MRASTIALKAVHGDHLKVRACRHTQLLKLVQEVFFEDESKRNRVTYEMLMFMAPALWSGECYYDIHENDEHTHAYARTNLALRQSQDFRKAFQCKEGDRMVVTEVCLLCLKEEMGGFRMSTATSLEKVL